MICRIHSLFLPLVFPSGVALGEGSDFNLLTIARNGAREPVLRGTALAGVLRHAYRHHLKTVGRHMDVDQAVDTLFGSVPKNESRGGTKSWLQVSDCVLDIGNSSATQRTHHLRSRHTGAVVDGALFSLEACPPNTKTTAALYLREDEDFGRVDAGPLRILETLHGLLAEGVTFGGNAARGLGAVTIDAGKTVYRCYDLTDPTEYAGWLNDDRAWRVNRELPGNGSPIDAEPSATDDMLKVEFTLAIPRGQDLLVGDGQGLDHEMEPQRVVDAEGRQFWRLPGASLRGMFRAWVTRLAARDEDTKEKPVDSVRRHLDHDRGEESDDSALKSLSGDNLGWCFLLPKDDRKHGVARTDCPIASLFGSLFQAGRLHITDAYARCSSDNPDDDLPEEQKRMHVAVDRITGGAAESMLFDNTVLTAYSDGRSPKFQVTMRVQDPSEKEAEWLARTLQALDLGILRVGSSKSSGRLELTELWASGRYAVAFHMIERLVEARRKP